MFQKFLQVVGSIGLSALVLAMIVSTTRSASASIPTAPAIRPEIVEQPASGNLLINPDFENGYTRSLPCCKNIAVPIGWNIR
jgi:hypothetical protein